MEQGHVYDALIDGSNRRPVIVVSRSELNRGAYVVIVPLTTARLGIRRSLPSCVFLDSGKFGVNRDCVAQAEAVTLLSKDDLCIEEGPRGRLDAETMRDLIRAIGYVFDADCEPN